MVTGTFLINNCCASVLFDTGVDKSFISHEFSKLLSLEPTPMDQPYLIELANSKKIESSCVYPGYLLELFGHVFSIDLIPITLGSFDVVIGMD